MINWKLAANIKIIYHQSKLASVRLGKSGNFYLKKSYYLILIILTNEYQNS